MLSVAASFALAVLLLASAGMKLASGPGARAALATYGIRNDTAASVAWAALVAIEAGLGVCVAAGSESAAYAAAGLFLLFTGAQALALMRGREGAPCGCFGARGRVSRSSLGRSALLAIAFAALPLLPRESLTTEEWLAIGLGFALLGVAALAVGLLALARELGALRMSMGPHGALEIPSEGPEIGGHTELMVGIEPGRLGLAVFTSDACHLCHSMEPAIRAFGRDPRVHLQVFDEVRDAGAWDAADVPGSPFAVAVDADGTVLAKGTFNTPAQLESVLATAERRRGAAHA
jgi:hypothetical protein